MSTHWPQARSPFNLPPGEINNKARRTIKDIRLSLLPARLYLVSLYVRACVSGLRRFILPVKLDYAGEKNASFSSRLKLMWQIIAGTEPAAELTAEGRQLFTVVGETSAGGVHVGDLRLRATPL